MFHIQHVDIKGFWGQYKISTDLNRDVNIFIGKNGTGKTTFINILQAVLTVDFGLIETLQFYEVDIFLKASNNRNRKISLKRTQKKDVYEWLKYKIGNRVFEMPLFPKEHDYGYRNMHPRYMMTFNKLRKTLSSLVKTSWLSVHREILEEEYEENIARRTVTVRAPVEQRLIELMRKFTSYQLEMESEAVAISSRFQKDVLASMLFAERFDTFNPEGYGEIDFKTVFEGLNHAYKDLSAFDSEISKHIKSHVEKLKTSVDAIKKDVKEKRSMNVNDVLPLALSGRTQHIIELSKKAEDERKKTFTPITTLLNILTSFANDKTFAINPSKTGGMVVTKGAYRVPLSQLSSGEKQLVVLLTETLLQRKQEYLFIADEPELSLHVSWQRKIISSIKKLNTKTQIIVATHSPEIAANWKNKLIDMESIINE